MYSAYGHVFSALSCVLFFVVLPLPASGEVKISDLEGIVAEAVVHRDQLVRREGNTFPVKMEQSWKFSVGGDNTIELTVETTARGPRGTRKAKPNSGIFTLDEVREVRSRGGGEAVWKFADGTLTFMRTFPSGAFRIHFAFADSPGGLTCAATEAFAREQGKREIELESPFGGRVTILSTKQTSSSCKVSKKDRLQSR